MKKEQAIGIIRHALTFLGGLLITKGLIDESLVQELSGAVLTLVGGVWSVIDKNTQAQAEEEVVEENNAEA